MLAEGNGHHSVEKEDFLENSCNASCFVQLKSILFNLLYVFDSFSQRWQSALFHRFIFFNPLTALLSAHGVRAS